MYCRLHRLGLVTATLLLSLTPTIKLAGTPLGILVPSAQAQTTQERINEALRLQEVGLGQYNTGQFREASQTLEQALVIYRAIGDSPNDDSFALRTSESEVLSIMGVVYRRLGQYPQALKYHEQALVIKKKIGDKAGESAVLNNIGSLYLDLGQYPQALKYLKQALAIQKEVGDYATQGVVLNNIGEVYNYIGQYPDALKYYFQALSILAGVGNRAGEGTVLHNIGTVYNYIGQYPQALNYFEQALVIRKEVGDKASEGITLNFIGDVYSNSGQYTQALKYYEQALVIRKTVGEKAGEANNLSKIGLAYKKLGQYADAEKTLFAAIEVAESLRPGLTDADKVSIFETQAITYRFLQQALIAQNKTNTALEIAERGRARAFVELLAEKFIANGGAQDGTSQQQSIEPPKIQEIQQISREQNATLVEYSIIYDAFKNQGKEELRQSELYIWVVKPTGEVVFKQVDLKSLKTSLEDLVTISRDSIGVRSRGLGVEERKDAANQTEHLQQLHKLLIEPIAQFLPTNPSDRIIFIPQNELFLVPFPALKDVSGKYLIEKHTILTAPAIQVLKLTRKQRQHVVGKGVLVVGNPTMPSISPQTGQPPQQLPSLPGAEAEANAIASLLNTKAITGNQATKTTVTQQMQKAKIIHLATHGLLDDFKGQGVPGAIALAPSGGDNGLLTSSEILDMKLNAELVVLSACDTGRGTITGDGVIGLSRSLISAGVPSVIVSLWSVPDAPTASLMTEFYTQMRQNTDKATALRQAMLTTMKQHPNPKDWAAFTLIGEAE